MKKFAIQYLNNGIWPVKYIEAESYEIAERIFWAWVGKWKLNKYTYVPVRIVNAYVVTPENKYILIHRENDIKSEIA
jgi:hypothetical protein